MAYTIACGDLMPGCAATFRADDMTTLLSQVATHAREDHGIKEVTSVMADKVRANVKQN